MIMQIVPPPHTITLYLGQSFKIKSVININLQNIILGQKINRDKCHKNYRRIAICLPILVHKFSETLDFKIIIL